MQLLVLAEGSQIQFVQDEDNEQDWYLEVVTEHGFTMRKKDDTVDYLYTNKTAICKKLFESLAYEKQTGRCLIAGVATEEGKRKLWAILTTSLKND